MSPIGASYDKNSQFCASLVEFGNFALSGTIAIIAVTGRDPAQVIEQTTEFVMRDLLNLHQGTKQHMVTAMAIKGSLILAIELFIYAMSFVYNRRQFGKIREEIGAGSNTRYGTQTA